MHPLLALLHSFPPCLSSSFILSRSKSCWIRFLHAFFLSSNLLPMAFIASDSFPYGSSVLFSLAIVVPLLPDAPSPAEYYTAPMSSPPFNISSHWRLITFIASNLFPLWLFSTLSCLALVPQLLPAIPRPAEYTSFMPSSSALSPQTYALQLSLFLFHSSIGLGSVMVSLHSLLSCTNSSCTQSRSMSCWIHLLRAIFSIIPIYSH